jgi:hypothetical protein
VTKYQVLIVKIRKNLKQSWKMVPSIVTMLETDTLSDIAIKLDEIQQKAEDSGDDSEYKIFFAVN